MDLKRETNCNYKINKLYLVSPMQHRETVFLLVTKLMTNKHMNTDNIVLYLFLSHNLAMCCSVFIPLESGSVLNFGLAQVVKVDACL